MILVIGARASGKRAYVESLGYAPGADPEGAPALLECLKTKEVVVCDEVGSGVIPLEKARRLGREATGRLCCQLAKEAAKVVRLVAGIPTVIKG